MARYMRSDLGAGHSKLSPPVVVGEIGAPFVAAPIQITLAGSFTQENQNQRAPRSFLQPPAVVGPGIVYAPLSVTLAPSTRPQPKSRLSPPTVLETPPIFFGPQVTLVPSARGKTLSQLARPVVVSQAQGPQGGVMGSLAPPL